MHAYRDVVCGQTVLPLFLGWAMEKYLKGIYRSIERIWTPDVCVQCHTRFYGGYFATTKQGYELVFCSLKCGDNYWEECGKFGRNPTVFMQRG